MTEPPRAARSRQLLPVSLAPSSHRRPHGQHHARPAHHPRSPRFHPPDHRPGRPCARLRRRAGDRLSRLRRHRRQPPCRPSAGPDADALAAACWPSHPLADRWCHHPHRRPQFPRQQSPGTHRRPDRPEHGRHRQGLSPLSRSGRWPRSCPGGGQRRVARRPGLPGFSRRRRPAFFHQPAAHLRCHQESSRPRALAVLRGIRLHPVAGLRLRRAVAALWLHPATRRRGPVGQHHQWCGAVAPAGRSPTLWPDHAAAGHP